MATTFTHPELAVRRGHRRAGARRVRGRAGPARSPEWSSTPSTGGCSRPGCGSSTTATPSWRSSSATTAARRRRGWRAPPRPGGRRASRAARSARRLADVTKERALLPLLTVTSQRAAGAATGPPGQGHRRRRAARRRRAPTGGRVAGWLPRAAGGRRARRRAGADHHPAPVPRAARRTDGDLASRRRRPVRRGRSPARSSSPTVPLEAERAGAVRLPAGARQPRRHHRGEPARARSTTSTRSSSTTSGSPSGARDPCCTEGKGVLPDDVRDRYREAFGDARPADGPGTRPRRVRRGLGRLRRAARPRRRPRAGQGAARDRAAAGAPPTASCPRCSRATSARRLIEGWRTWLADPTVEAPSDAAARPGGGPPHREGPGQGAHRRAGDHPGHPRRAAPRPAQGHQAAALPARVLRFAVPDRRAQGVRRAS